MTGTCYPTVPAERRMEGMANPMTRLVIDHADHGGGGGKPYDVFISYRQQEPDGPWVRGVLVERLRAAGLRVFIDYESFRLGAPLVLEMARGVEQSRYTLAVLSPAYLASNFTEFEGVLAEHLGLELSQRRLLAVRLAPCQPRLSIRARLWLDMTSGEEVERNLPRLISALREPPLP
jgi:TIR domain